MEIFHSNGKKLDSKLLYAENSTFYGYYNTDKIVESGNYYFQFFTNYMNNFSEDESVTYKISILNPEKNTIDVFPTFNSSNLSINYSPESGVLLENTENTIVAEIKDYNGLGGSLNIEVLNDKNEVLSTSYTNG